jgi:hypothetical protein
MVDQDRLKRLLLKFAEKKISLASLLKKLRALPFDNLGISKIDTHRAIRCGFPEVVLCEGKSIPQIKKIAKRLLINHDVVLLTRANKKIYRHIRELTRRAKFHKLSGLISVIKRRLPKNMGKVLVITGGTADIPVAEEAGETARAMGCDVEYLYDVGVAGVHRLLSYIGKIQNADVLIVVAGMEGALPSIVGGLTSKPVIAVPTSVGYGASFKGLSALLTMLNTCASGVMVVNIDNGFGAGYSAATICGLKSHD